MDAAPRAAGGDFRRLSVLFLPTPPLHPLCSALLRPSPSSQRKEKGRKKKTLKWVNSFQLIWTAGEGRCGGTRETNWINQWGGSSSLSSHCVEPSCLRITSCRSLPRRASLWRRRRRGVPRGGVNGVGSTSNRGRETVFTLACLILQTSLMHARNKL